MFFFFKQKTAYEMRISDWSSDVCSSDLGRKQAHHVDRRRRRNDLQAGELHAPVLDTLAVLSAEARSTAVADADHERAIDLPVGHITALVKFVRDIIIADGDEIREHDLCYRLEPGHRRTHRRPQDRLFRDRRVTHTQRTELLQQTIERTNT